MNKENNILTQRQMQMTFREISQLPLFEHSDIVYKRNGIIAIDGGFFMSMVDRSTPDTSDENPDQEIIDQIKRQGSIYVQKKFESDSKGNIAETTERVPLSIVKSLGPDKV